MLFKVSLRVVSNFVWFLLRPTLGTEDPSERDSWVSFWPGEWSMSPPSSPDGVSPHLAWWLPWKPYSSSLLLKLLCCFPWCHQSHWGIFHILWESCGTGLRLSQLSFSYMAWYIIVTAHFHNPPLEISRQEASTCLRSPLPIRGHVSRSPKNSVTTLCPSLEGNIRAGWRFCCSASIHLGGEMIGAASCDHLQSLQMIPLEPSLHRVALGDVTVVGWCPLRFVFPSTVERCLLEKLPNQRLQFPARFLSRSAMGLVLTSGKWVEVIRDNSRLKHLRSRHTSSRRSFQFQWLVGDDNKDPGYDGKAARWNQWITYKGKVSAEQEHPLWTVMWEINYCVWAIIEFGSLVMAANATLLHVRRKHPSSPLVQWERSPHNEHQRPYMEHITLSFSTSSLT